jgi:hypothetical protein
MAGLDTSIALGIRPVDFGDPNEGRMNALRAQMMQMQMQQGQFNMMKAQRDMEYQDQQRAQAAAAAARDKAAEKDAINAFLKTGSAGYRVNPFMDETAAAGKGVASDAGTLGGQMYPDLQPTIVGAQPKNYDEAINALTQQGKVDAARKAMGQNQALNVNESSNVKLGEEKTKAEAAKIDSAMKTIAYHVTQIPAVTPENYATWRASVVKDIPGYDSVLAKEAPTDPNQFSQMMGQYQQLGNKMVADHYASVTEGENTKIIGIRPGSREAYTVAGSEGTVKPAKETKSKLAQAQEERQALVDQLQKDPYNSALQSQVKQYDNLIAKETKEPGNPDALIPPNSKLFLEQTQKHEKDLKGVSGSIQKVDSAVKKIDQILDPKYANAFDNLFGGYSAYATQHFTGDTATIKAKFDSLKSDMKAVGLDIVRAKGGIGAMTVQEWPIVQDMIDKLDPTMPAPAARAAIEGIKSKFQNMVENDKKIYDQTWGQTQFHAKDYGYVPMGSKAGDRTAPAANGKPPLSSFQKD